MTAITLDEVGAMIREAVARQHARIARHERRAAEALARQQAQDAETDRLWEERAVTMWREYDGWYSLEEIRQALGLDR